LVTAGVAAAAAAVELLRRWCVLMVAGAAAPPELATAGVDPAAAGALSSTAAATAAVALVGVRAGCLRVAGDATPRLPCTLLRFFVLGVLTTAALASSSCSAAAVGNAAATSPAASCCCFRLVCLLLLGGVHCCCLLVLRGVRCPGLLEAPACLTAAAGLSSDGSVCLDLLALGLALVTDALDAALPVPAAVDLLSATGRVSNLLMLPGCLRGDFVTFRALAGAFALLAVAFVMMSQAQWCKHINITRTDKSPNPQCEPALCSFLLYAGASVRELMCCRRS
jgi:hypothetical protein